MTDPLIMPRAYDPDLGEEARALVPAVSAPMRDLVAGVGGSSPYLAGLIRREHAWLEGALADPKSALEATLEAARTLDESNVRPGLREAKRRIALLSALMDLGGIWSLEEVTGALTDLADTACHTALRCALSPLLRRGKIPGLNEEDAATGASMSVIAMGKMGAGELNYSSDIDLICLFDETRFDPSDFHDARAALVKATRAMSAALNDQTGDGYVFRTDLRLRPDPSVTPVVLAMEAAERYYESLGRTWERAAYIKARAAAGDLAAGARFLEALTPFVWRRHLDFAAIEDAHAMRLAIRQHKGTGGPITLPGHNMKLGRGGIREIEFFAQTHQLITGGRDPSLRVRGTVPALHALAQGGWISTALADDLTDHYRFHRTVEHRLQMINDAQTHALPGNDEGFARLAALMGRDTDALKAEIHQRLDAVHSEMEAFFAPSKGKAKPDEATVPELEATEITERWPTYPALRSARGAEIFERIRPEILTRLAQTDHPNDALLAFDRFLAGLPAGVQVFSLFAANPQLIDLIVDIAGTAPALAEHLARNARVLDAVIGGDFWADWPGADYLVGDLRDALSREEDYERKLDAARRWAKEWHFRIGVHHLRGLMDGSAAGQAYADLADAVLAGLWPEVVAQFSLKHGPPPGRGAMVLGMGSLGAARLTSMSDLDLIVIYDPDGIEASDGPRPLQTRPYYARLTQALVTALTAPMAEGRLYEVDMRLRPSGTQGPVATSWGSFENYQRNEAWVWEHLALTRARVITGSKGIGDDVETLRGALMGSRDQTEVLSEVATMRRRIAAAKAPEGALDAKIGAGRMQDIELFAQAATLIKGGTARSTAAGIEAGASLGLIPDAASLQAAYGLQADLQMALRLLGESSKEADDLSGGGARFVLRETGQTTLADLETALARAREEARSLIDAALPDAEPEAQEET